MKLIENLRLSSSQPISQIWLTRILVVMVYFFAILAGYFATQLEYRTRFFQMGLVEKPAENLGG